MSGLFGCDWRSCNHQLVITSFVTSRSWWWWFLFEYISIAIICFVTVVWWVCSMVMNVIVGNLYIFERKKDWNIVDLYYYVFVSCPLCRREIRKNWIWCLFWKKNLIKWQSNIYKGAEAVTRISIAGIYLARERKKTKIWFFKIHWNWKNIQQEWKVSVVLELRPRVKSVISIWYWGLEIEWWLIVKMFIKGIGIGDCCRRNSCCCFRWSK